VTRTSPQEVSLLLHAWRGGDKAALDKLMPLVYGELHRLAHRYMIRERAGRTLQTTALVNESYLRLVDLKRIDWQDRAHFFAIAASFMRRILVDFARSRGYQKRGGDALKVSLDEAFFVSPEQGVDLVKVDEALEEVRPQTGTASFGTLAGDICHAVAIAQARNGHAAAALRSLEQATASGWLDTDPELKPLRTDPRFEALLDPLRHLPPVGQASACAVEL
jgi:RNA polymerase sigma factor (TIGR02999 family)